MSEEKTQNMPDWRSFEERVFARFDAMGKRFDGVDRRLDNLDARLSKLEAESERRAVETKPIWERALAEILAVQQRLDKVEERLNKVEEALKDFSRKFSVLGKEMLQLRSDQLGLEERLDRVEPESTR